MDPRLLQLLQPRAAVRARDGRRVRARVPQDRRPAGARDLRVRRPLRRAAARGVRLPGGARAAARSTPSSRASPSTCSRSSTRTTSRRRRRWRSCSSQPNLTEGALAQGYRVPRGTVAAQRARPRRADGVRVPDGARRDAVAAGDRPRRVHRLRRRPRRRRACRRGARGALRLRLRTTAGLNFADLALDELTLFLRGGDELPMRLYEQLLGHARRRAGAPDDRGRRRWQQVDRRATRSRRSASRTTRRCCPTGRARSRATGCCRSTSPSRRAICSCELRGPARGGAAAATAPSSRSSSLTDAHDRDAGRRGQRRDTSRCICTPAVNLFPRRADRIHLTEADHEYHVVPDRTRPMDFEVHSVDEVVGLRRQRRASSSRSSRSTPGTIRPRSSDAPAYYTVQRQPRVLSARAARSRARGRATSAARCSSRWSTRDEGPYRSQPAPARGRDAVHQPRPAAAHAASARGAPTSRSSRARRSRRSAAWPARRRRAPSHAARRRQLAAHQPPVAQLPVAGRRRRRRRREGGGAARAAVALCRPRRPDDAQADRGRARDGVAPASRGALPVPGPITFGRGLEVTVTCDEAAFEGSGVFLLGAVLERFFAKYVSINSFTETVLRTRAARRGHAMADANGRRTIAATRCSAASAARRGRRSSTRSARAPERVRFLPGAAAASSAASTADQAARSGSARCAPADEPMRLGQEPDRWPSRRRALAAVRAPAHGDGAPPRLRVNFFGLLGPERAAAAAPHRVRARSPAQRRRPDDGAVLRRVPPPDAAAVLPGLGRRRSRRSATTARPATASRPTSARSPGSACRRCATATPSPTRPSSSTPGACRGADRNAEGLAAMIGDFFRMPTRDRGVRRRLAGRCPAEHRWRARQAPARGGALGRSTIARRPRLGAPAEVPGRARAAQPRAVPAHAARAARA